MPAIHLNVNIDLVDLSHVDSLLRAKFGARINGLGSGPSPVLYTTDVFTDAEMQTVYDIIRRFDKLDDWEPSKLRNLTIQQINDRIATVQAQIDAVSNVATAKTALNSMYADMQKMARIILWQLRREMGELE